MQTLRIYKVFCTNRKVRRILMLYAPNYAERYPEVITTSGMRNVRRSYYSATKIKLTCSIFRTSYKTKNIPTSILWVYEGVFVANFLNLSVFFFTFLPWGAVMTLLLVPPFCRNKQALQFSKYIVSYGSWADI